MKSIVISRRAFFFSCPYPRTKDKSAFQTAVKRLNRCEEIPFPSASLYIWAEPYDQSIAK